MFKKAASILFIAFFIIVTWLLLVPTPPEIGVNFSFMDKINHFAAFGLLAFLLSIAVGRGSNRKKGTVILTILMLAVYGILMELIQPLTGRTAEIGDIFADLAGLVCGCCFSLFFL